MDFVSVRDYQVPQKISFQEPFIIEGKCDTSTETSLPSTFCTCLEMKVDLTLEFVFGSW